MSKTTLPAICQFSTQNIQKKEEKKCTTPLFPTESPLFCKPFCLFIKNLKSSGFPLSRSNENSIFLIGLQGLTHFVKMFPFTSILSSNLQQKH